MNKRATETEHEIVCQQVLVEDATVFSVQWTVFPRACMAVLTPAFLLEKYLAYVRRFTFSLIRPQVLDDGVEFRLLGTARSLISFTGPLAMRRGDGRGLVLAICGGILVQRDQCDRGELTFMVEPAEDGMKATLQLSDYCPLLLGSRSPSRARKWLYRFTQAFIHRVVTIRFLSRVYRELTGRSVLVRVVRAAIVEGEDI